MVSEFNRLQSGTMVRDRRLSLALSTGKGETHNKIDHEEEI